MPAAASLGPSLNCRMTFVRCSSTPSAEIFVCATGSTRSTTAGSGGPPQFSICAAAPGFICTASCDRNSAMTSTCRGSPTSTIGVPVVNHRLAFLRHAQHAARARARDVHRRRSPSAMDPAMRCARARPPPWPHRGPHARHRAAPRSDPPRPWKSGSLRPAPCCDDARARPAPSPPRQSAAAPPQQ